MSESDEQIIQKRIEEAAEQDRRSIQAYFQDVFGDLPESSMGHPSEEASNETLNEVTSFNRRWYEKEYWHQKEILEKERQLERMKQSPSSKDLNKNDKLLICLVLILILAGTIISLTM